MEVNVVLGDVASLEIPAVVVNLFEGVTRPGGATGAADRALDGAISRLIAEGEIKGKLGEVTTIHTLGKIKPARVLVAGLGRADDFTLDRVRIVAADAGRSLRRLRVERAATIVHGAGIGGLAPEQAAQALAEGTLLGLYTFERHKSKDNGDPEPKELLVVERDEAKLPALQQGVERGRILAQAANRARDLANEPANHLTPTDLAAAAAEVARDSGLEIEVFDREQMQEMGMGALLAVAQGSQQPPKLIVLRHWGAGKESSKPPLGLVGKGITFDSGGISIKPAEHMGDMKGDMAGGAAVICAMGALGKLNPRLNVIGIVPATENLPSGSAYKPGDVLRALNGKTIEVVNTDAEGRVILADALSYARKLALSPIVDVATLTGACMVALGDICSGIFGNNQSLVDKVMFAGAEAGERYWQLPLYDEYRELIKSDTADIKNSAGRPAGAITAAMFLSEFVENTPWAHLDIAGTDRAERDKGYTVKGATGVATRTLVNLALALAEG